MIRQLLWEKFKLKALWRRCRLFLLVTAAVACWKFFLMIFLAFWQLKTVPDQLHPVAPPRLIDSKKFSCLEVRGELKIYKKEKNLQRGIKNKLLSALQAWSEIKILPFYAIHSSRSLHSFTKHIIAHKSLSLQTTTLYHIQFSSLSLQFQRLQIVNYFNNC